jgi:hypothetical protein
MIEWRLRGTVLVACNCDYGCPCNFNALPTKGHCEGGWTWSVDDGQYGDARLDGLVFSVYVRWPGPIHAGGGKGVVLYDERADESQRAAVETLVGGGVGGPWGVLAWTWEVADGPRPVRYEVEIAGDRSSLRAGDALEIEFEPIANPVTGAEVHPGAVLPEGIVFKQGSFARTRRNVLRGDVEYDHSGQYAAFAPFEYSGP